MFILRSLKDCVTSEVLPSIYYACKHPVTFTTVSPFKDGLVCQDALVVHKKTAVRLIFDEPYQSHCKLLFVS